MIKEQTARLEARLPAAVYAQLKRAAQIKGRRSVTSWSRPPRRPRNA